MKASVFLTGPPRASLLGRLLVIEPYVPQAEARARRGRLLVIEPYVPQVEARAGRGEGEARAMALVKALVKALAPTIAVEPDHGEGGPQ